VPRSPVSGGHEQLLADCDDEQRLAITSDDAPLFVRAGAGSGKTRVLTRRVAWRIAEGSAAAGHTLVATFTRKAASELRQRLSSLGAGGPVTAGTLHAIALAELRRLALDRGRSLPVVLDRRQRLLERLAAEGALPVKGREGLAALVAEIDWAKARLVDPAGYAAAATRAERRSPLEPEVVAECFSVFELEKHRRGLLDFDDLLRRLAEEIAGDPDLAAAQRWRFRHFFLDELQDLSAAQLQLVEAWLGGRDDLFAVGDADQAIYGWGGALEEAFGELLTRYPQARVLDLQANYRSSPQIVSVAGALRGGREAIACGREGASPTLTAYPSAEEEATGVARAIAERRRHGLAARDCAVLARTNAQLRLLGEALEREEVPTRASLGAFLLDPEVAAALRTLRAAGSPEHLAVALGELAAPRRGRSPAVAQLVEIAGDYLAIDPLPSGGGLVTHLRQSLATDPGPGVGDGVDLLSFHRAKGLEWPVVFVTGLEEGLVPVAHARSAAAKAEEARLLYVALSRAERELHCSWAERRLLGGAERERHRSRLVEGPLAALEPLGTEPQGASAASRALAESRAHLGRGARRARSSKAPPRP